MPPSWFDHCLIFPGFQYLVGCLLIGTKTYHIQIWNLTGNPVLLHVHRKYLHCKIKLCSDKMPSSNPLAFLRPLYDIAVWQFLCGSLCLARRVSAWEPGNLIMLSLRLECTRWSPILSANCSSFKHSITWNKKFLRRKPNKLLEIGRLGNRQLTKWFTGARWYADGNVHSKGIDVLWRNSPTSGLRSSWWWSPF